MENCSSSIKSGSQHPIVPFNVNVQTVSSLEAGITVVTLGLREDRCNAAAAFNCIMSGVLGGRVSHQQLAVWSSAH